VERAGRADPLRPADPTLICHPGGDCGRADTVAAPSEPPPTVSRRDRRSSEATGRDGHQLPADLSRRVSISLSLTLTRRLPSTAPSSHAAACRCASMRFEMWVTIRVEGRASRLSRPCEL
jgi:hypothetical protein